MSETNWTPGEWRTGRSDMVTLSGDEASPYYKNVYVDDPRGGTHQGRALPYIVGRGQGNEDECRANAALFAAAKNLYATLEALVVGGWIKGESGLVSEARAVLAKARGE